MLSQLSLDTRDQVLRYLSKKALSGDEKAQTTLDFIMNEEVKEAPNLPGVPKVCPDHPPQQSKPKPKYQIGEHEVEVPEGDDLRGHHFRCWILTAPKEHLTESVMVLRPSQEDLFWGLKEAIDRKRYALFDVLASQHQDLSRNENELLKMACRNGLKRIVCRLLASNEVDESKKLDSKTIREAIREATEFGHDDVVKFIMAYVDDDLDFSEGREILLSLEKEHFQITAMFLDTSISFPDVYGKIAGELQQLWQAKIDAKQFDFLTKLNSATPKVKMFVKPTIKTALQIAKPRDVSPLVVMDLLKLGYKFHPEDVKDLTLRLANFQAKDVPKDTDPVQAKAVSQQLLVQLLQMMQ